MRQQARQFPNMAIFDLLPCDKTLKLENSFRNDHRITLYKGYKHSNGTGSSEMVELGNGVTKASLKILARELLKAQKKGGDGGGRFRSVWRR
jgi:hypothetical protein